MDEYSDQMIDTYIVLMSFHIFLIVYLCQISNFRTNDILYELQYLGSPKVWCGIL